MENKLPGVDGALPQPQSTSSDLSPVEGASQPTEDARTSDHNQATDDQFVSSLSGVDLGQNLNLSHLYGKTRRSAEECLEIGRRLTVFRAACKRGTFHSSLKNAGIGESPARRFMEAFRRLSKMTFKPIVSAVDNQSKIFQLLPLDDEQLEELAIKGATGPLVLSEIATMAVKDVREAVQLCLKEKNKSISGGAFSDTLAALIPGDRVESLLARRPGAVVKIYADGSACVCWDDGEPQEAGLGHERMPRNLLVKVASEAAPARGDVNAAFEAQAATASNVNEGGTGPTAAPKAAPQPDPQAAPADNIRRVDAQLQVHWAGRVFDVSKAGVGVGDDVMCQPAPIPPFLWVRKIDASQQDHMATMVEPVEPPPQAAPPDPAIAHRKLYLRERMKVVLRYADGPELNDIEDLLDELVSDISRGRYVPGLVAADYELTRRYWIEGGAK